MAPETQDWSQLLRLAALNQLALASFALRLMDDPKLATDEVRDELVTMVEQLEDAVAHFEEFVL